jgi:hypothetical protein
VHRLRHRQASDTATQLCREAGAKSSVSVCKEKASFFFTSLLIFNLVKPKLFSTLSKGTAAK